jgi:hypothetical protein
MPASISTTCEWRLSARQTNKSIARRKSAIISISMVRCSSSRLGKASPSTRWRRSFLPAKQRLTHPNDWMSTDAEVACPDPNCPTLFRIKRTGIRHFQRSAVTAVPLHESNG